jgi:hypothetical protein
MSSSITCPLFGSRAVIPATKTNPLALIACEKGPTGFGARSVEIARNFAPEDAGLLSAPLAMRGVTAAASPLTASFLKNALRFISSPASTISNLKSRLNSEISNLNFKSHLCSALFRITAEARPSYFNHVPFLNGYEQAAHSQHLRSRQDVI